MRSWTCTDDGAVALAVRAVVIFLGTAGLLACEVPTKSRGSAETPRAMAVLSDSVSIERRMEAARSMNLQDDAVWSSVASVAWSAREPNRLRLALMQMMVKADPARFWSDAEARWRGERSPAVHAFLREASAGAGEHAAAAFLLRWAELEHTPERYRQRSEDWLSMLSIDPLASPGDTAHAVLWDWLASERPWVWRVAAWRVITDLADGRHRQLGAALRGRFDQSARSPFMADLRATVDVLGVSPTRGWELYTLRTMRSQPHADGHTQWHAFAAKAFRLPRQEQDDLAMRHAAWLTSAEGVEQIAMLENASDHARRNGMDARVAAWLAQQFQDPALVRALFAQADADHADANSEHGGLVTLDAEGRARLRAYAPAERRHDRAYIAPASLSLNLGEAVATYHFHAERHANAEHAGPGSADRRAVEENATLMVVLTFLDRDTLAVYVAAPGDQLFDLGVVRRP